MKLLRNAAIGLVLLIIALAVVGFFLPSRVVAERSIAINAPQATVFTVVNSLRTFSRWSPWSSLDPQMSFAFEGPDFGVGQKMTWSSSKSELGTGSMEIKDSVTNEKVALDIDFGKMGRARSGLSLAPDEAGTKVTWAFTYDVGGNPFARYMGLVMPGMIGNEYERGLANLKAYVESIPKVDLSNLAVSRVTVAPRTLIAAHVTSDNTGEAMAAALGSGYGTVQQALAQLGLAADGAPISIARGTEGDKVAMDAAIPVMQVSTGTILPSGVKVVHLEEGEALRVVYRGAYAGLNEVYIKLLAYALINGWKPHGSSWNEYVSDPALVPEAEIETDVYLPVE